MFCLFHLLLALDLFSSFWASSSWHFTRQLFRLHQFRLSAEIGAYRLHALEKLEDFKELRRCVLVKQMQWLAYAPKLPVLVSVSTKHFVALIVFKSRPPDTTADFKVVETVPGLS